MAYTKPRQEKSLAWDLCRKELHYFLPMVLRETSSGGRRRKNLYPLFPSYLFFAGGENERLAVLKTKRVAHLIEVHAQNEPTFVREIANLELAIRHAPSALELYPRLICGAKARIKSGPMKDVEGIVIEAENKKKLLLSVSMLGVGATVEVHADLVEVA